jgi:hypothetical protein
VRLRPSIRLARVTDHREESHSNSLGTANFQNDFRGYRKLIFALGDSYTQGTGLPADQSYPIQLDLILNTMPGGSYEKNIAVVNLGLAAFGGEQTYRVLERYTARLGAPSACLYLGSENDYDDDLLFKSGARHRHVVRGSPEWKSFAPLLIWIGNLQIVLRAKLIIAKARIERLREADRTPVNSASRPQPVAIPTSVAELEWPVISRIVSYCKAHDAVVVLAWSKPPGESRSYDWLATAAGRNGLLFNDWYRRVEAVTTAIPALPIANDHSGGHYRGWVNGEIANGFADVLRAANPANALNFARPDSLSDRSKSPR